jgi:membrane-bound lytic murein transglycosylase B
MKWLALGVLLLVAGCAGFGGGNTSPQAKGVNFATFYEALEQEVKAQGLGVRVLRASYQGAKPAPLPDARKAEKSQPEFTNTLTVYMNRAVSDARVARGKALLVRHQEILNQIQKETGVPAELIVALWGMESDYGRHKGTMPLVPTLVSMAYKSPRHEMFKRELFMALRLEGVEAINGSWAGASGHCQFMPSNIVKHGRDGNGDRLVDIWNSEADAFASTANFIRALGYAPNQPWFLPLEKTPDLSGVHVNKRGLSDLMEADAWRTRGVDVLNRVDGKWRYYKPEGLPMRMVGPNYEALLGWNYSSYFATSVWMLAERLREN